MNMKRNKIRNNGGVDRISELPEGIIHRIMSHLSSKEVAQTCVLSKTWYNFRKNYPVLDFTLPHTNVKDISDYLLKIIQAVYDSLNHFSSNKLELQTFAMKNVILGQRQPKLSPVLDSWIKLAVASGVKELNLYAEVRGLYLVPLEQQPAHLYTLPQSVFSSQTLTILELSSCVLDLPVSMFGSLRKLSLSECILKGPIILTDTDCPVLEELRVQECMGEDFRCIYISSLLRLHTVVVDTHTPAYEFIRVEILSQSIENLAVISDHRQPWSDINIHGCNRLKSLYLESEKITDTELHSLLSNASLLEELYLFNCCALKMIKISSALLKILEICFQFGDGWCDLIIEVSAPNLETFIYRSCKWETFCGEASRIEMADCCRNLKTLVLYNYWLADKVFHNLISRSPLLENIWIIGCHLLPRINIPNPQLKRLHIVRCYGLKSVEISTPNLSEVCFTAPKVSSPHSSDTSPMVPEFSIGDDVLRGKGVVHSSKNDSRLRLREILKYSVHVVKVGYIFDRIVDVGARYFKG